MSEVLHEALQLQREAALEGFDWSHAAELFDKLREEADELRAELDAPEIDPARVLDEMGDVLFCVVNLARKLGVDPAQALAAANEKFRRRYGHVRAHLDALPPLGDPARLDRMEGYWREAKRWETGAGSGET